MSSKSTIIKLKNQYYKNSNDLSALQFDPNISDEQTVKIQKQQDEAFKKYSFMKELSKAYDKTIDEQKEEKEFDDYFFCSNCRELFSMDEMGNSELAMQDRICKYCMEERGYGN